MNEHLSADIVRRHQSMHKAFLLAAAAYQNSGRTHKTIRSRRMTAALHLAWDWEEQSRGLAAVKLERPSGEVYELEALRMKALGSSTDTRDRWALARIGRSGERQALVQPSAFIREWTTYRITAITEALDAMRVPAKWREVGPLCKAARITSNEALATLSLVLMASATGADELSHLAASVVQA